LSTVGIIANPASGKDLRRIISRGLTVTNAVKENAVQRMLLAMDRLGVERVLIMPDRSNLARRVLSEVDGELQQLQASQLEMPYVLGTQDDSIRAAALMVEQGVDVLIVLGGDGTSRVVSKRCGDVPILPVSTGTNNVFPEMIEGTVAGMAAAALATGVVTPEEVCRRAPRLELLNDKGDVLDHALVDLAVIDAADVAARAVWEPHRIRELYLTQARVDSIGMSAIGAQVQPLAPFSGRACRLLLGEGERRITAPIAPGLMAELQVRDYRLFEAGETLEIGLVPSVIALDGEREVFIRDGSRCSVRYNAKGPLVVDIRKSLQLASGRGYLNVSGPSD
jgi:predicted polyphosphate/ATP-dependent NAD kinase